eukprot:403377395
MFGEQQIQNINQIYDWSFKKKRHTNFLSQVYNETENQQIISHKYKRPAVSPQSSLTLSPKQQQSIIERVKKVYPYFQESQLMENELNSIKKVKQPLLPKSLKNKVQECRQQTQTLSPIRGSAKFSQQKVKIEEMLRQGRINQILQRNQEKKRFTTPNIQSKRIIIDTSSPKISVNHQIKYNQRPKSQQPDFLTVIPRHVKNQRSLQIYDNSPSLRQSSFSSNQRSQISLKQRRQTFDQAKNQAMINEKHEPKTPIVIQNLTINNYNFPQKQSRFQHRKEPRSVKVKDDFKKTSSILENFSVQSQVIKDRDLQSPSSSKRHIPLSGSKYSLRESDSKKKHQEAIFPINESQFAILDLIGEGHFGKVYKAKYDSSQIDYDSNKYNLPLQDGIYALKVINVQEQYQIVNLENVFNEKFTLQKLSDHQKASQLKLFPNFFSSFTEQGDIKPENVMIDSNTGLLKLVDFGFSKQLSRLKGKNRTYTKCGTPLYTAPELVNLYQQSGNNEIEENDGYSFQCDIWK